MYLSSGENLAECAEIVLSLHFKHLSFKVY